MAERDSKNHAMVAIRRLHSDKSKTTIQVKDDLEELREEIDTLIDALEVDLKKGNK